MDFSNWQSILALVCVAVAVTLLIRRAVRLWTGRGGCGGDAAGCGECPSHTRSSQDVVRKELVSLNPPESSPSTGRQQIEADDGDST